MTSLDASSSLEAWSQALARPVISPAGGSAAAMAGVMSASLVAMVAGLTLERERYADVHAEAARLYAAAERLRIELLELAGTDARVLADLASTLRLPSETESERQTREASKRQALTEGARVQLDVARRTAEIAAMGARIAAIGPPSAVCDAATATFLAVSAARSAYWATRNDFGHDSIEGKSLLGHAEAAERRISELLAERFG